MTRGAAGSTFVSGITEEQMAHETFRAWPELSATGTDGVPTESAVYGARAALASLIADDGSTCPPSAILEALAGIIAERAADAGELEDVAELVIDLENLAAKWRRGPASGIATTPER